LGIPISRDVAHSPDPPKGDTANAVICGEIGEAGVSLAHPFLGPFNVSVWGDFTGAIELQRSFDGGVTFLPRSDVPVIEGPASFQVDECETHVAYRIACLSLARGVVFYRLSQTGRMWGS
jgi:hypothetical protein